MTDEDTIAGLPGLLSQASRGTVRGIIAAKERSQ
jgi:hypothetical protein